MASQSQSRSALKCELCRHLTTPFAKRGERLIKAVMRKSHIKTCIQDVLEEDGINGGSRVLD